VFRFQVSACRKTIGLKNLAQAILIPFEHSISCRFLTTVVTAPQTEIFAETYNEGAIAGISMDKTNRGMRNAALLPEAAREERGRESSVPACAKS
jgi:hypothetical protein